MSVWGTICGKKLSGTIYKLEMFRRAATYGDKILKGAKPADLPVEQPMKFDFVANLKAGKQIGARFLRTNWHERIRLLNSMEQGAGSCKNTGANS
jgi:ABC-type uncharacterized transport system substrate-binding protein